MTYGGDLGSISTLAHEAGHAFHSWMMRDLPLDLMSYPMTLAETASIFAETVLKDHYVKTAKGSLDRYLAAWEDATSAYAFILLVPQRFDFEKAVYEKIQSRGLSASEFKKLYTDTEKEVYGDTLTEVPEMGWASTLHYYISGLSFYNFPYTFGYLFSLGVYAQKDKLGDSFFQKYIDLLRDTGRMTAEELAEKHLGVDLTQHAFWEDALGMVSKQITHFESLVDELF